MEFVFGNRMTIDALVGIAHGTVATTFPKSAFSQVEIAHQAAERISRQRQVYGRSTGVGANRLTSAGTSPEMHGLNLVRSHAVDSGPSLSPEVTRATVAVRLNQLLRGQSGIDPEVVRALAEMLRNDALPELREFGSVGTGDLPTLSGIALALLGERETSNPLAVLSEFRADSALPFISSSAMTIGRSALLLDRIESLTHAQVGIFALSVLAGRANREAFAPRVAEALPSSSASTIAVQLAALLSGTAWEPARIQDPYAFRGFLPTIAVLACATERLRACVEDLMNAGQENPLIDAEELQAYHHGAFFQVALAHEVDSLSVGLAQHAPLIISRLRFLNDDTFSGLPRFLAPANDGSSGTMMIEYVAGSAMGEIMAAAAPISTQSAVLSCGVEDDVTFAATASSKLERAVNALEVMLSCELLIAVRALRLGSAHQSLPSRGVGALFEHAMQLPSEMHDRDLRDDLEIAKAMLPGLGEIARNCQWEQDTRADVLSGS